MQLTNLRMRLTALFALLAALISAVAFLALQRLQTTSASLDTVYRDRVVCLQQLHIVGTAYGQDIANAVARLRSGTLAPGQVLQVVARRDAAALAQWDAYRHTTLTPLEAQLVAFRAQPALAGAHAAALEVRRLLALGDVRGLDAFASRNVPVAFDALSAATDELIDLQQRVAKEEDERSQQAYRDARFAITGLVAAAFLLGGGLAWSAMSRYTRDANEQAARMQRMSNYYLALSQTNQLIVRESDVARLLSELCRICVECGHARMACVTRLDVASAARVVENGPAANFFDGVPREWNIDSAAFRRSLTATTLREGLHAISNDYRRETPQAAWRQRAIDSGIQSAAAFPLLRAGRVFGALTLYASDIGYFDDGLVRLLDEMVGDVSFALDNVDRESARQTAQAQVQASLERFQQVFQLAPVSTVIATLDDHRILEVNEVFCTRYGFAREEVLGRPLWELGIGLLPEDTQTYRARVRSEPRVRNLEVKTRARSGEIVTLLINSELIDYAGEACVLSMSLDVTELRQAEQARESQAAAEAASRAKTAFLARMSHELRTPLNAVLGFAQLMRRESEDRFTPMDLERLEHIRKAGWHLLSLVNDVLDVSSIESGQLGLQTRDVALAPLLDDVVQIAVPLALQSGVELVTEGVGADPSVVRADPVRLRQVLINLLSNAIKYNRVGGIARLRAGREAARVWVEVIDTGIGMTGQQLAHLYEPFNRLGRERGGIEGTGLGLSLTRQLVQQMGGVLEIDSRPGEGTCARVTLPAADAESAKAARPPQSKSPAAATAGVGDLEPSGTVLYIEDNEVNVMLVEQMLARWSGVRLLHAPDGRSGIELVRELEPDLLLLDMQLPDMDGLDVLRKLAADGAAHGVRVVALSASAMTEDIEAARRHGVLDYWTKPLDVERFLADIAIVLTRPTTSA